MDSQTLASWITACRDRTFRLVEDLSDEQLMGPRLAIVNPLLWEIGHVAWFQENWVLRHHFGGRPIVADGDSLYDSSAIPHDTRWDLPLPSRQATLDYLRRVRDSVLERVHEMTEGPGLYFALLTIFHEDMHDEAFLYTRQTLRYPPPGGGEDGPGSPADGRGLGGDAVIPGGRFSLGSDRDEVFVFDNEKWAHEVEVTPFRIAKAPVTQSEYAEFVQAGGYREGRLWSEEGWAWRNTVAAEHPVHWRRSASGWERRHFDQWLPLEPHRPVIHVNWHEANAFCQWAGRRLPTEIEWEAAASCEPGADGRLRGKRRYPWGDTPPDASRAHLEGLTSGCADVSAFPAGDSAFGCRQMLGNVWEWTASSFDPYPGFSPDPYRDYSQPWFGTHKVLRGGAWMTTRRMIRSAYRNFYTPDRRDVWAGFRTCAR